MVTIGCPSSGGLIVYPDVLYSGRFQSKDDGQTWQEVSNEYPVTGGTPGYPSALYHFNSTGVLQDSIILLISRDGAVTWNQVLTPQVREQINIVDFDSFVPPNIVLGWPEAGLFKANALDPKDWTKLHWPPGTSGRKEVAFHPTNPDVFAVSTADDGVFVTFDGGGSWVPLHQAGYQIGNVVYQGLPSFTGGLHPLVVTGGPSPTICIGSDEGPWCHGIK